MHDIHAASKNKGFISMERQTIGIPWIFSA
jgi:hypothetical protein